MAERDIDPGQMAENQAGWQGTADNKNAERPLIKRLLGKDKETAYSVMYEEADDENKRLKKLDAIPRSREGSPYIEVDINNTELVSKIRDLRAHLEQEIQADHKSMDQIEAARENAGENAYRAPEINPTLGTTHLEFALMMLDQVEGGGKLNFMDFSVEVQKKHPEIKFDEINATEFGRAAQFISRELGLEESVVGEETPANTSPSEKESGAVETSGEHAEMTVSLEYDLVSGSGSTSHKSLEFSGTTQEVLDQVTTEIAKGDWDPVDPMSTTQNGAVILSNGASIEAGRFIAMYPEDIESQAKSA